MPDAVKFKVPATSANLGPGFDSLGLALALYDTVEMKRSDKIAVAVKGEGEDALPLDASNLMVQAARHLYAKAGKPFSGIEIKLSKSIPVARGLGSSSAAIVAGLHGANALLKKPFGVDDLLVLAGELEGHPDNVAPALLGGFTVAWMEAGRARAAAFPTHPALRAVLCIPEFYIRTTQARAILPYGWSREDTLYSLSRAALLTACMVTRDLERLPRACADRLHEPYRGTLIPGYSAAREALLEAGALGVAISGSGPTIIALTAKSGGKLEKIMVDEFKRKRIKSRAVTVKLSTAGAG